MAYELIVQTLQALQEACKDAEADFTMCAQHTDSDDLKGHFLDRAARSRKAALELRGYVIEYGGKSDVAGSASGALHRGWLKMRGALLGLSEYAWLEECNRTELLLLTRYRRAMQRNALPQSPLLVVERQFYAWQHLHAQMRGLRNLVKAPM